MSSSQVIQILHYWFNASLLDNFEFNKRLCEEARSWSGIPMMWWKFNQVWWYYKGLLVCSGSGNDVLVPSDRTTAFILWLNAVLPLSISSRIPYFTRNFQRAFEILNHGFYEIKNRSQFFLNNSSFLIFAQLFDVVEYADCIFAEE